MRHELSPTERHALLARLRIPAEAPSLGLLGRLQRAWCFAQPFHNLDLLAASLTGRPAFGPGEAIERCLVGLGGPCHVHAAGFLALLRTLGFDAVLAPATIGHPDDHLGVRVILCGRTFWCDVGNGQPYLVPFPADGELVQVHLGWTVRSSAVDGRIQLDRTSPDQPAARRVYVAEPTREMSWDDFTSVIDRHHREPGFGPFLTGLRVVRMGDDEMITVRDDRVTTYSDRGFSQHRRTASEIAALVSGPLGLAGLPVHDAITAWQQARSAA